MKLILSENDYVIVPAGTVLCVASEESLGKFSRYIVTEKEFAVPASGIQGELLPSTYTNKVKMACESANNSLERETEFMKSQMKEAHERRIQAERDKVDELNRELRDFKCLENRRKRSRPMADLIKKAKIAQILAEKEKIKTNVQNLLDPCCKYEGCEESEPCCEGACEPCESPASSKDKTIANLLNAFGKRTINSEGLSTEEFFKLSKPLLHDKALKEEKEFNDRMREEERIIEENYNKLTEEEKKTLIDIKRKSINNPTIKQSLLKADTSMDNSSIELEDWRIELENNFNVPPDVLMGLSEEQGKRILETANTLRELKKELEDAKITLSISHLRK